MKITITEITINFVINDLKSGKGKNPGNRSRMPDRMRRSLHNPSHRRRAAVADSRRHSGFRRAGRTLKVIIPATLSVSERELDALDYIVTADKHEQET